MAKITVIGSFVMDSVATMDEFPKPGQTIIGKTLGLYPGGKGANQCVTIARLGGDVEMIGMLGRDGNGETFRKIFKEENICIDRVFDCDEPTAMAQIQLNAHGENRICVIPSANHVFSLKEVEMVKETIKNTSLVVLQLELTMEVTEELINVCFEYGVPVILNPAPAVKLSKELLSKVTYLTPNETEMEILSGLPTNTDEEVFKAADSLLDVGVKTIVATLGKRGALIATKEKKEIISGYTVKTVDTVAAGDSFNGALAKCLMDGKTLEESVKYANAVGALTVTKKGAIPSLPYKKDVEEFIKNN
ncbi:MAG: ribokinase [Clostridia bacterium]|nr:ribokinase [Clostridia bacterium]